MRCQPEHRNQARARSSYLARPRVVVADGVGPAHHLDLAEASAVCDAALAREIWLRLECLERLIQPARVEIIDRDRDVQVASGARETAQLQRHATDQHELNPGASQDSQQLAMAILDLDHPDAKCSLRALRDE